MSFFFYDYSVVWVCFLEKYIDIFVVGGGIVYCRMYIKDKLLLFVIGNFICFLGYWDV